MKLVRCEEDLFVIEIASHMQTPIKAMLVACFCEASSLNSFFCLAFKSSRFSQSSSLVVLAFIANRSFLLISFSSLLIRIAGLFCAVNLLNPLAG